MSFASLSIPFWDDIVERQIRHPKKGLFANMLFAKWHQQWNSPESSSSSANAMVAGSISKHIGTYLASCQGYGLHFPLAIFLAIMAITFVPRAWWIALLCSVRALATAGWQGKKEMEGGPNELVRSFHRANRKKRKRMRMRKRKRKRKRIRKEASISPTKPDNCGRKGRKRWGWSLIKFYLKFPVDEALR